MNKKNLYLSNLAWDKNDTIKIFKLLEYNQIRGIDLAPVRLHSNWLLAEKKAKEFNKTLKEFNLKINAIQGIFFKTNFNLFEDNKVKNKKLINHFKRIIRISKIYNCKKIILGSSNFRYNKSLNKKDADTKFIEFFKKIAPLFKKNKILVCFEPIPKQYGENYLYNLKDLVSLIKKIKSPWMKINFDTSLYHYQKFSKKVFLDNIRLIKNIQISEKKFLFFDKPSRNNKLFCKILKKINNHNDVSLEMISNKTNLIKFKDSVENLRFLLN